MAGWSSGSDPAHPAVAVAQAQVIELRHQLDQSNATLAKAQVRLDRLNAVARYSGLYGVPADLAGAIYDIALAEGIHPSLGFQLVKVESRFKAGAVSPKGAIGYTQLRVKTARFYDPEATERSLHDRDTNLRIGFRFLYDLMGQFDQDLSLALLAYNRGPARVAALLARGEDPANGYAEIILRGVKKGS
jgi:soluble lytic murein transglycosylase-like protein